MPYFSTTKSSLCEMSYLYFWHHFMLLTLKEDYTTASFCPCCLLQGLSMIIYPGVICTSLWLNTIILCTDGVVVYMCPCILLVLVCAIDPQAICLSTVVCTYIYGYCKVTDKFYIRVHVLYCHYKCWYRRHNQKFLYMSWFSCNPIQGQSNITQYTREAMGICLSWHPCH